ncbi:MAG TPA: S46 family peptidase [Salinivirgaceae bacterium]|nr:S46 family peptidase [Salinivirgaceae bacterium]HQA75803.1 S46 family peptidase [Salinivirgaceae bacterium]
MIKKTLSLIVGLLLIAGSSILKADEGMWLPVLINKLNIGHMTEKGFKLTAEDVYSINNACLKDAIVALNYGSCTAELISDEGLLLTNHHCAYDDIQSHSSVEHDYLTEGFWAITREQELPNEGKTVSFLIRAEDVTERILASVNDEMPESERTSIIDSISKAIVEEVKNETPEYRANVGSLLHGNQFMLFVYEDFKDIRLVGAPPESIGKFGADTDNWEWPRHTGDFALYRIYANKDNQPAEYSVDNVPYKPKSHLKVSIKGIQEGDYAMIMGYPGRTDRYLTSWGVKNLMGNSNAIRVDIRGIKQGIWAEAMDASDEVRIKYSSKYASSSNYWKYSIGQNRGLKNLNVKGKKEKIEADFAKWVEENPDNVKYSEALDLIKNAIIANEPYSKNLTVLVETLLAGTEGYQMCRRLQSLQNVLKENPDSTELNANLDSAELIAKPDNTELIAKTRKKLKEYYEKIYEDFEPSLDLKVAKAMIEICMKELDVEYQPDFVKNIKEKYNGNIDDYISEELSKSIIYNKDSLMRFIETAQLEDFDKDAAYMGRTQIMEQYRSLIKAIKENSESLARGNRLFVEGLMKMMPEKTFAPDANSTMRVTYGTVGGYKARDAVYYDFISYMEGVMEKENPNDREFTVLPKLKELYENKDFGRYADKNGKMPVGFLSNTDITGGNSGSPVLNANGELIGCAFDGNWEAMSGDIAFEPDLQRTISVDIRYVLFIIDKFAGAKHLVDEMTIVE